MHCGSALYREKAEFAWLEVATDSDSSFCF